MRRVLIGGLALALSGGLAYLALVLGAFGFGVRSYSLHDERLRVLVEKRPTLAIVTRGLSDEGAELIGTARDPAALDVLAARHAGAAAAQVSAEGRRWAETRAFRAGDFVYFIYFDAQGFLRAYTLVGTR